MAGKKQSYSRASSLGAAKSQEFKLVDRFPLTYRNREDITNLPPGVLIVGSQNTLSNVSERLELRKGYVLDGQTNETISTQGNSFDWITRGNGERHLRSGGLTTVGNDGKLQYRYVDPDTEAVSWKDLETAQTSVAYNFTTFWDVTESLREVLWVNGASDIRRWNGALAQIASTTVNSITISEDDSVLDSGFYTAGNLTLIINGNTYAYTGVSGNDFTGVTPAPTGEAVGSIVRQAIVSVGNGSFTSGPPATFKNGLISTLNNQLFLASLESSAVWISKVNDFTDFSVSIPRIAGEGGTLILDDNIVAFKPQESYMYVSAGQDRWYNINFELQTSTVGVTYQQLNAVPLKTGKRQGAMSQAFVSHMKNDIIVGTNETTIDTFGRVDNIQATPQMTNISDSIKLDIDSYDFTGGCIFYHRYNILVSVPVEGIVLIYSLITKSWEAPQLLPVSRFYIVDGELYGHSYETLESYKLFTGYADRAYEGFVGHPIDTKMTFSYQNYGTRASFKKATALYIEGYINANTTLNITLTYELDGCATMKTFTLNGSDTQFVCIPSALGSLGKVSLGKIKLGGDTADSLTGLPPKFRAKLTFPNTDFYECSLTFEVRGVDNRFELLAFGLNASDSTQNTVAITA